MLRESSLQVPPSLVSVSSEVSKHINGDHSISLDNVRILEVEPKWFERGVRESIQIRINSPTLNKDVGRYNLPPVWNNTLEEVGKEGGIRSENLQPGDISQCPQLHQYHLVVV